MPPVEQQNIIGINVGDCQLDQSEDISMTFESKYSYSLQDIEFRNVFCKLVNYSWLRSDPNIVNVWNARLFYSTNYAIALATANDATLKYMDK